MGFLTSNNMTAEKSFYDKVYDIVAQIPEGYVMTYGQIAEMLGSPRASRVVGGAMSRAPSNRDLPCHRVVNRQGTMSPAYVFGGPEYQKMELVAEGVTFLPDGSIDLEEHLYTPDE